jgi:hypothetical protein
VRLLYTWLPSARPARIPNTPSAILPVPSWTDAFDRVARIKVCAVVVSCVS